MAFFYIDTDAGSDAAAGTSWATAKLTTEGVLAVMSAGDMYFMQGAAADNSISDRTITSPGTLTNPCMGVGVADGTTNEGTSIVVGDLASTLPVISTTGAAPDINFQGTLQLAHIDVSIGDRGTTASSTVLTIINGKFSFTDRFAMGVQAKLELINTEVEPLSTSANIRVSAAGIFKMNGGSYTFTAAANIFESVSIGNAEFKGVDLTGLTAAVSSVGGNYDLDVKMSNCKIPASITLHSATPSKLRAKMVLINCSNTTSVGATSSIQDYQSEDAFGSVDLETTIIRTGGSDDGASGGFAYALTPHANTILESSNAVLDCPWIGPIWVTAGSSTATVYISNDSASTDLNQDEGWCDFYTIDVGDTAQHDQTFDPANARLLFSSAIITDDTGSTWGTGGNNHQKMSSGALTYGFEGPIYARPHIAKRQATADTYFVDMLIEIT